MPSHQTVTHLRMEVYAVVCLVLVVRSVCICDAGIGYEHVPADQLLFQFLLERAADPFPLVIFSNVDRDLGHVVIGLARFEVRGIGIAHDLTIFNGD